MKNFSFICLLLLSITMVLTRCNKESNDLIIENNSLREDVKNLMTNIDNVNTYKYDDMRHYSKKFQKL